MAAFSTTTEAESRCRQMVAAGTWVNAHVARNVTGHIVARFQRFMSPSAPGEGAWVETTDNATT
ncbi:hypothetical protein W02_38260 [Nitrospira sp. KM1]|uniref:hypothetical protein n=1 Tax=Nitrospira sp. KM1 TaxID=1936990 RepID=UPI0013A78B40|nr:hypothetical protein [Nitrospira sp. KM1]BCA56686.1 hypothetical protein W02_38260 [Nitrospira sp. KM1]